ncbi:MAG TPA: response regulator transcription factor [Bryobacteraceae bacterium]|jgi:DNA-binding NarL/FixJ family response regulator|nr:response regulator transcription factor [Bryobacteraceae bacterium]
MPNGIIRVLVADDHAVVRNGIAGIVNAQPDMKVVAEAPDGKTAVDQFEEQEPDICLIDLQMPQLDGVGVVEQIKSRKRDAHVIILTTYDTDEDIERAIRAGAKAYLLKDVEPRDLLQCIRDVHAGKTTFAPAIAAKLASRITSLQLTTRELEVLKLIAEGKANKEIGSQLHIAESTVKLHVNTLFEKLSVKSRTEAMRAGLERGLIRLR